MAHPATRYVTKLDSTTSLLRALARFLRGRDFPALGIAPCVPGSVAEMVNLLPPTMRASLYRWTGWLGGTGARGLSQVRSEEISDWVVQHYPRMPAGGWNGAMLGSANGAAVHLAAALGIPWLPQTFLTPVRRSLAADDLMADLEWGREPAAAIAAGNPDLCVHQMHDPVHDRQMVQRIGYFRLKRLRLGRVYEEFLREQVRPGSTIFTIECRLPWPVTAVTPRHLFQVGGFGDATPGEYLQGGPRVRDFLHRFDSGGIRWRVPAPTAEVPEGEWGFREELLEDVRDLARLQGWRVRRILFDGPDDLSPLVADLHRWWYQRLGLETGRLLVECFALLEPYWALRTGSVPYWLAFTSGCCAAALERYVAGGAGFDEMNLMLFSNGIEGIGMAPIDRWRSILGRARVRSGFVGVNERQFPRDYASFVRYHTELKRRVTNRLPLPSALTIEDLDEFLAQAGDRYAARIVDEPCVRSWVSIDSRGPAGALRKKEAPERIPGLRSRVDEGGRLSA